MKGNKDIGAVIETVAGDFFSSDGFSLQRLLKTIASIPLYSKRCSFVSTYRLLSLLKFFFWQIKKIQLVSSLEKSQNCLCPSRQQCPPSTGNQRNLNCLRMFSKRVKNPKSAHRRRQNKLFPLSHSWRCAAGVQKHQQHKLR